MEGREGWHQVQSMNQPAMNTPTPSQIGTRWCPDSSQDCTGLACIATRSSGTKKTTHSNLSRLFVTCDLELLSPVGLRHVCLLILAELPLTAANTFSSSGSLVTGRNGCTMTLLPNGKVLAAGGYDSVNVLASAQ